MCWYRGSLVDSTSFLHFYLNTFRTGQTACFLLGRSPRFIDSDVSIQTVVTLFKLVLKLGLFSGLLRLLRNPLNYALGWVLSVCASQKIAQLYDASTFTEIHILFSSVATWVYVQSTWWHRSQFNTSSIKIFTLSRSIKSCLVDGSIRAKARLQDLSDERDLIESAHRRASCVDLVGSESFARYSISGSAFTAAPAVSTSSWWHSGQLVSAFYCVYCKLRSAISLENAGIISLPGSRFSIFRLGIPRQQHPLETDEKFYFLIPRHRNRFKCCPTTGSKMQLKDKSLGQISFKRIAQLSHEIDRQRVSSAGLAWKAFYDWTEKLTFRNDER